ncbi:cytochrome c1 [Cyclopterus lumpus]|uniref:cytochrome c1 n=1 Tax=Cyclopterus lumpus TaxID=8103 RepID=UPI0014871C78|nr:cytochrome c1 [Cyclopterus lumpus]
MNVQLLLLLALAVPFCAFTHASPTEIPEELDVGTVAETVPEVTEAPKVDFTIITGPPATEPAVAPEEVATEEVPATEEVAATEDVASTEVVTEAALPAITVNTEEGVVETEAAATEAPEPIITDAPVVDTADPTETAPVEVQTMGAAKGDVVIEDNLEEGLSSGQVVGIVIGALLAMVIVIAVVIAVVRRMGKYSP